MANGVGLTRRAAIAVAALMIGANPMGCTPKGQPTEPPPPRSGVLNVPSEYPTIRAAIAAAIDGDTIRIAKGRYRGYGNTDLDPLGKAILITGEDDPDSTIIDCRLDDGRLRHGFLITRGEGGQTEIERLTITGSGDGGDGLGTAITCRHASPSFRYCVIRGNGGGVINLWASTAHFYRCRIQGNSTTNGEAIIGCRESSPTFLACQISSNVTWDRPVVDCNQSHIEFRECRLERNVNLRGAGGGAIGLERSTALMIQTTIAKNSCRGVFGSGGAVYLGMSSSIDIRLSTIVENSAQSSGGAILANGLTTALITQSIVRSNCAPEYSNIEADPAATILVNASAVDTSRVGGGGQFIYEGKLVTGDPMFCRASGCNPALESDYHLQPGSPCVGDPWMGAFRVGCEGSEPVR